MNICICGGGNLGHVVSGYLGAKSDVNVGILTRHPERWARQLEITLPDGSSVKGKLAVVTKEPQDIIPQAEIVLLCLPGMYIRSEIENIKPYLKSTTIIGSIVSSTGFFFQTHELIPSQPTFGLQRVPFIARTEEYGHKAHLLGFKSSLNVVIENYADVEKLRSTLEHLFDTPVKLLDSFTIKDIDTKICDYEGHDFGEWSLADNLYYARVCHRCGKVEYSIEMPKTKKKK